MTQATVDKAKELATVLQRRYPGRAFEALAAFRRTVSQAGHFEATSAARIAAKVLIMRGEQGYDAYRAVYPED